MEAVSELGHEAGAALLATRSAEEIAKLALEIPSDDAAALIDNLPEELSAAVLHLMRPKESGVVENLLEYAERTAGRIMNPNVFALIEDMTVGEAITEIQSNRDVEMVFYLYVVDERRHLVGVVSLRRLLLVSPETPLKRIMTADLSSARVDMDQEEVARLVAAYNILAIPVVDEENKLVGIITVDDVIDVIKDERPKTSSPRRCRRRWRTSRRMESLRKRMPWLASIATAFWPRRRGLFQARSPWPWHLHARGGRHGRKRGDPDPAGDRPGHRARRAHLEQLEEGSREGAAGRHRQRPCRRLDRSAGRRVAANAR
jgi:magnesium transporter